MDDSRVSTIREKIFLVIFPIVLIFVALYPYSVWHAQILITSTIVFFVGIDWQAYRSRFDNRSLLLFVLLLFSILLSTIFSINKLNSVPQFFSYLTIFFLLLTFPQMKKPLLTKAYIYAALFLGTISITYSFSKIFFPNISALFSFFDTPQNLIIPFFGHAFYAIFLIMTFPFVSSLFLMCIYSLLIIFSFSKIAIAIWLLQMALIFRRNFFPVIIILTTIFSLLILLIIFVKPNNTWFKSKLFKSSAASRFEYINQGVSILKNSSSLRLLVGNGSDTFYELSNRYQSEPGVWSRSLHNYYFQYFIEHGLFGALLLFFFIISVFKKNFRLYSFAERMSIVSVLLFSTVSTVNLNLLPVLFFFLIISLKKKNKKKEQEKSSHKIEKLLIGILGIVLIIYWVRYVIGYIKLSYKFFPYETSFWSQAVETSKNNTKKLLEIKRDMKKFSNTNVELSQSILNNIFANGDYCQTGEEVKQFISLVPNDTMAQNQLMQIHEKCPESLNIIQYFKSIKTVFKSVSSNRTFFQFAAAVNFNDGDLDEYKWWSSKAWNINVVNTTDKWQSELIDKQGTALFIKSPFRIDLQLKTKKDLGGVVLQGVLQKPDGLWWEGISAIYIATRDDGYRLYSDFRDGSSEDSQVFVDQQLGKKIDHLVIYFDQFGNNAVIQDKSGNTLAQFSSTTSIFPEGKMFIGYTLAAKSSLSIENFFITPL